MKTKKKLFHVLALMVLLVAGLLTACASETVPAEGGDSAAQVEESAPAESAPAESPTEAPKTDSADGSTTEEQQPSGTFSANGELVSDLGFRPEQNGFGFPNYGGESGIQNLTEQEVRRLFGDQVCARLDGDVCELTPPGQQWMEQTNNSMSGGHCEGMATLSLLFYSGQVATDPFGGDPLAFNFSKDNEALQREIAYWWATQTVTPTQAQVIKGTPNDILDVLKQMQPGGETYTVGIYKRDGSGGHAVTPFGVEDQGNGTFAILVYDNNYPSETRRIMVDSNQNTWSYEASINPAVEPDLYEGDAETMTLDLTPTSSRMTVQDCPFCAEVSTGKAGSNRYAAAPAYNQVYLDGEGHLLIVDEQDHRLGFADGKLVNEIPGANYTQLKMDTLTDYPEPMYQLPAEMNIMATIDGSTLTEESETDMVIIGKGYSFGIEGILLSPEQKDNVIFQPADQLLSYDTDGSESPNIVIGVEQPGSADFYFEIQGADMEGGGTINVSLDTKNSNLLINTEKLTNEGLFNLVLTRITDEAEDSFTAEDIVLKAGSQVYIEYGKWEGNGKGLYLGVDTNGDDTIDDEYELTDAQ